MRESAKKCVLLLRGHNHSQDLLPDPLFSVSVRSDRFKEFISTLKQVPDPPLDGVDFRVNCAQTTMNGIFLWPYTPGEQEHCQFLQGKCTNVLKQAWGVCVPSFLAISLGWTSKLGCHMG